jgi:hypothetical protein
MLKTPDENCEILAKTVDHLAQATRLTLGLTNDDKPATVGIVGAALLQTEKPVSLAGLLATALVEICRLRAESAQPTPRA